MCKLMNFVNLCTSISIYFEYDKYIMKFRYTQAKFYVYLNRSMFKLLFELRLKNIPFIFRDNKFICNNFQIIQRASDI